VRLNVGFGSCVTSIAGPNGDAQLLRANEVIALVPLSAASVASSRGRD
jgi:hypothetical protein